MPWWSGGQSPHSRSVQSVLLHTLLLYFITVQMGIMVILYEDVLVLNNFGEHEEKLLFRGNQCPLLSEARAFVVKHSAVVASEANNGPFRALPERNIICR